MSSGHGPAISTIAPSLGGRRAGTLASRSPPRSDTNAWCTAPSARDSSAAMSRSPVPFPAESPASCSLAMLKSRESSPEEVGGSGPARPDEDAPPASPPATESARVRSPLVSFNSATRRVNRSPGVRPARAGWEHRVRAARRRDVCAHLFCFLGVVRVAAKRRSVATPAGDAAARPELANIPDVSLSPETREALFQISAHPGCGVDAANLFSNVKEEAWARKPCLFGGSNFCGAPTGYH